MTDNNVTERLYAAIRNDPLIKDASKILFSIEKEGPLFKKHKCLNVEGSVANEVEFQKIESILEQNNTGYEVVNRLKINTPNKL
jgi:hypothetical protein